MTDEATTQKSEVPDPEFADVGEFQLDSGEAIKKCRVGYRTVGTLNEDKSNIVVWVPNYSIGGDWIIENNVGPDKLIDPVADGYFLVVAENLGNGISSSPSNSMQQADTDFPAITFNDIVHSQKIMIDNVWSVDKIHALIGASMGGMLAYQWMVSYPDYMERAISITGSPRPAPYDMFGMAAIMQILDHAIQLHPEDLQQSSEIARSLTASLMLMTGITPEWINNNFKRDAVADVMTTLEQNPVFARLNPYDWKCQLQAMMKFDVAGQFGGSLGAAAKAIKTKVMIIAGLRDWAVTTGPALEIASLLDADLVELKGDGGHRFSLCAEDFTKASVAIHRFLAAPIEH